MERQLSENLLGKTLDLPKYLTLDTLGVVRIINLSSVCSCWAFFCRAEVAHPASIIICSHVAVMLSGIIIARGWAATIASLTISSISHCHWNTMSWHFTAVCVESSSTHHFISATL